MMQDNHRQTLYEYLEATGVLENGTPEDITSARKEYWRQYRTQWRRAKRAKEQEFTISLNSDELTLVSRKAQEHEQSVSRFIKESTLAYCKRETLIPHASAIAGIREQLILNCTAVQQLCEEADLSLETERWLVEKVATLEQRLLGSLKNVLPIEEAVRTAILNNPQVKKQLLAILKNE